MTTRPIDGPDGLFPYVLVHVAETTNPSVTRGVLLLERPLRRAAFLWPSGRYATLDLPSSLELQAALEDAQDAVARGIATSSSWLGGIVQAFDPHWGEMTVLKTGVYEVRAGEDEEVGRRAVLQTGLGASSASPAVV